MANIAYIRSQESHTIDIHRWHSVLVLCYYLGEINPFWWRHVYAFNLYIDIYFQVITLTAFYIFYGHFWHYIYIWICKLNPCLEISRLFFSFYLWNIIFGKRMMKYGKLIKILMKCMWNKKIVRSCFSYYWNLVQYCIFKERKYNAEAEGEWI